MDGSEAVAEGGRRRPLGGAGFPEVVDGVEVVAALVDRANRKVHRPRLWKRDKWHTSANRNCCANGH